MEPEEDFLTALLERFGQQLIATSAKILASAVFVSGRSIDEAIANSVPLSPNQAGRDPLYAVEVDEVDEDRREVTLTLNNGISRTARYLATRVASSSLHTSSLDLNRSQWRQSLVTLQVFRGLWVMWLVLRLSSRLRGRRLRCIPEALIERSIKPSPMNKTVRLRSSLCIVVSLSPSDTALALTKTRSSRAGQWVSPLLRRSSAGSSSKEPLALMTQRR